MAHLPFLMDRASAPEGEPCGHALMASCPPAQFQKLTPDRPFGESHSQEQAESGPNQGTWEISKADLSTLLDLSQRLDLDGEITPVMAWGMIMSHPRFSSLTASDLSQIATELGRKVRCYGYVYKVICNAVQWLTGIGLVLLWKTLSSRMPLRVCVQTGSRPWRAERAE